MRTHSRLRPILEITAVLFLAVSSIAAMHVPAPDLPAPAVSAELLQLDETAKPKAETLSYIVQAGDVLIFNLPQLLGGKEIEEYTIKRAPALSWLVKRSFFWRTLAKDVGEHEILLNAEINGQKVEDVVVEIEIR